MERLIEKMIIKYLLKHYNVFERDGIVVRAFSMDYYFNVVKPNLLLNK